MRFSREWRNPDGSFTEEPEGTSSFIRSLMLEVWARGGGFGALTYSFRFFLGCKRYRRKAMRRAKEYASS
jgi:hypothetical protein